MPNFQDFVDQLDASGIVIEGRGRFISTADASAHWPDAVTDLVVMGAKLGVHLYIVAPDETKFRTLLRGYPFTEAQQELVLKNITVGAAA